MGKILDQLNDFAESVFEPFRMYDKSPEEMVTVGDVKRQYTRKKSFTDFLPYVEYLKEEQVFFLEDCYSVMAGFEFSPINVEGFPLSKLASDRDMLMQVLKDYIPEEPNNPWIVNVYFSNTYSLEDTISEICKFNGSVDGVDDEVKKEFNKLNEVHLKGIAKEQGIFHDTQVTNQPFNGKKTTGRLFLYRKRNKSEKKAKNTPIEELTIVRDKILNGFKKLGSNGGVGIDVKPIDGKNLYEWMFRWFNPNPSVTNGDVDAALKLFPYPEDDELLVGRDFSNMLSLKPPKSNVDEGVWEFDEVKHKYLTVQEVRQAPKIGVLSAPKGGSSIFDAMPPGSMFAMTIVFQDKISLEKDIKRIKAKAVGDGAMAREAQAEAEYAEDILVQGDTILPIELGFYIKADSKDALTKVKNDMSHVAAQASLQLMDDDYDFYACDSYLRQIPGNYKWNLNKERNRAIKLSLQHVANYMPILGRGTGTGTPVQIQFNRGGEPMMYDVIGDRAANSHAVMIGSTGAGKSAKLVDKTLNYVAQYDARVFIIEKGESFKLMMEYLEGKGKTVNSLKLARGSGAVIPPYANAYKALEAEESLEELINKDVDTIDALNEELEQFESADVEDFDDSDEKDYLGEMELITRIFVTGGDAERNKEITISDQSFIRRAIINAAKRCRDEGKKHPLVEDVAEEMKRLIETDDQMREKHREKAYDFGEGIKYFTSGLAGELFNRTGDLWKDADITHIDLGDVTRDGKQAELAVAYASILNQINDIAEKEQYSGRPIIVITDEGHNIVSKTSKASAILVPAVVKIVKMWRKLNGWYWIATQNVGDFSDEAAAILKLCEWWEVLSVEDGEDEEIARFKKLTDDQASILSSVTMESRKYSEGFVMCRNKKLNNQIFRNVPSSLSLCLAMTDPKEKRQRKLIMEEFNCSELRAVEIMADRLNVARGITKEAA